MNDQVEDEPKDDLYRDQIIIPIERIGILIGIGGKTISALREETQTSITVENETGVVTIEGLTQQHVDNARKQIEELTSLFSATLQINRDQIGQLIGKGGQTINGLKEGSDTEIKVEQNTAVITVEGNTIEKLSALLEDRGCVNNVSGFTNSIDNKSCKLFGRGGSTITSIRNDTKTRIDINKETGFVTITGNVSANVQRAYEIICSTVWVASPQASIRLLGMPVVLGRSYSH